VGSDGSREGAGTDEHLLDRDLGQARDHLANERTFLAWLRTGIAVVVLGFAIGRLGLAFPLQEPPGLSVGLGTVTIVGGVGLCILGLRRYGRHRRQIALGTFAPGGREIEIVGLLAVLFGAALALYLLVAWTQPA
jgi:putative membrane protein